MTVSVAPGATVTVCTAAPHQDAPAADGVVGEGLDRVGFKHVSCSSVAPGITRTTAFPEEDDWSTKMAKLPALNALLATLPLFTTHHDLKEKRRKK